MFDVAQLHNLVIAIQAYFTQNYITTQFYVYKIAEAFSAAEVHVESMCQWHLTSVF